MKKTRHAIRGWSSSCTASNVMRYYDEDDPKRPRPVNDGKKTEGWAERGESRKDDHRDDHRHVHVRC